MVAHGLTARRVGAAAPDGRSAPAQQVERPGRSPGAPLRADLDADERQLDEARERLAALVWPPPRVASGAGARAGVRL